MGGIRRGGSRGRGREGFEQNALGSPVDPAARDKGIGSSRKQASAPTMLFDSSFPAGYKRSTSKKAIGTPMKMLIDEEVAKDVNARHTSPGVIGRLMGLDTLPSFGVDNQQKNFGGHSQRSSPGSCSQDKYGFSENIPRRRSTDEMPEFKDVFEVMEATRMNMHRSPKSRSGNMGSRLDMVENAEKVDFIRQKFKDAKRLSTDESLQKSKEFNDALEALVSNKDIMLEFLQETNPVLTKDLPDLSCSPSSDANRITILKPSRMKKFIDADIIYPLEKDTEKRFRITKDPNHSSRKPHAAVYSQSIKEDCGSFRQKLSKSAYAERNNERIHPTRIVVLKPNLEKTQNVEGAFPLTHEFFHCGYRRSKSCQHVGIKGQNAEESMQQMRYGDYEASGHKAKGSREIAREITKQMMIAARGGASGKRILKPELDKFDWDERSCFLSSLAKVKTSESFHRSSELHDDWARSFSSSPTYSTETSVSKEARKRLLDRWKMTHQYQEPTPDSNGLGTLGEMLALSDWEVSKVASGSMVSGKCAKGEPHSDGTLGSCSHPLGISSKEGWKEATPTNLTRSRSVPSSSIILGSPKSSSRKRSVRHSEFSMLKDVLKVGPCDSEDAYHSRPRRSSSRTASYRCHEDEMMFAEREIHVNSEEPTNTSAVSLIAEQRTVHPETSDHETRREYYLDDSCAVQLLQDVACSPSRQNQLMQQESASAADVMDERLLVPSLDDLIIQAEGIGNNEADHNSPRCNPPVESGSPMSSKEDEQPSPVSVLESSLDTEDAYSGGFEKISADLQELRMQLRLLKMETMENADETELLSLSDDEMATRSQPLSEMEEESHAFRDEEERDFSYLLDMLMDLGVHAASQDELLSVFYLSDHPAGPDVYSRLEKKYHKLILWPQSERKLLFDLTNSILADIVASLMRHGSRGVLEGHWPKWDQEGFVEEVWHRIVLQRREMECAQGDRFMDLGWFGSEDGIDMVGTEIGTMLHEALLEEVIADLV